MSGKFSSSNTRAAKLTADQVLEIRRLYHDEHWSQPKLSRRFGVSGCQIGRIVRGESWQQYANITSDAELEHIAATSGYVPTPQELAESMARLEALRAGAAAQPDALEQVLKSRGGDDPLRRLVPTEETRNEEVTPGGDTQGAGTTTAPSVEIIQEQAGAGADTMEQGHKPT